MRQEILTPDLMELEYEFHPYCLAFPTMPQDQFEELKEDISGSGLLEPIVLFEGKILDGRHRYLACLEIGIEPEFTPFPGPDDAMSYVISRNARRRHLTRQDLAMAGARLMDENRKRAKERQGARNDISNIKENFPRSEFGQTRDIVARQFGGKVSGKSIEKAEHVQKKASPSIQQKVNSNDLSIDAAYELSKLPQTDQDAFVMAFESEGKKVTAQAAKEEQQRLAKEHREKEKQEREAKMGKPYLTLTEWQSLTEEQRHERIIQYADSSDKKFNSQKDNDEESMGNIEWAKWSWNPVTGCKHDCPYCYARDIANRFYEQKFEPSFWPERLAAPMNTTVPDKSETAYRNVFSNSMSDLYGRWVPQEWIDLVFEAMKNAPQWNFLTLTKFPKRAAELTYPKNVWIGTSVDLQVRVKAAEQAFERIECGTRWLSLEPLIEPLTFEQPHLFDWVVIGGASASSKTPEWTPPAEWIIRTASQFLEHGAKIYLKTNGRPREFPGAVTPKNADEVFHYLGKK